MNLLARREHSETELIQKLRKRDFIDTDIRIALHQLTEEGLQSNARFIENYIHSRQNKGYGPLRIHGELLDRGIKEDFIEHHLNITDNTWFINVRKVWQKRFKSQRPRDFKARAQQMRFLQYRGFTHAQIESIFTSED